MTWVPFMRQENQTVLVHGAAGSVGTLAVQYLAHKNCRVLATSRSAGAPLCPDVPFALVLCR